MQDGEVYLAGTARPAVARMSAATAAEAGVADGDKVTVATGRDSVTLPVEVTTMVDKVVWMPADACPGTGHGNMVALRRPTEGIQ
jgi:NADH-quinone oxidoreductase subunit G